MTGTHTSDALDELFGPREADTVIADFYVFGLPKPQGSKRGFVNGGRVQMVESAGAPLKSWREDVRQAALAARDGAPAADGPLQVDLGFYLPRPQSHYGSGRNAARLKESAPGWPATRPDVDKLARAVCDSCTSASLWGDDSQVVALHAVKRYSTTDRPNGCRIRVTGGGLRTLGATS